MIRFKNALVALFCISCIISKFLWEKVVYKFIEVSKQKYFLLDISVSFILSISDVFLPNE